MVRTTSTAGRFSTGCDADRDATAVVHDPHAAVGEQCDLDGVGVAGERLVDGVVHDLVDEVVQAALAGGADVHAGALADRLEAFEDSDRASVVGQVEILLPEDAASPHDNRRTHGDPGEPRCTRPERRCCDPDPGIRFLGAVSARWRRPRELPS